MATFLSSCLACWCERKAQTPRSRLATRPAITRFMRVPSNSRHYPQLGLSNHGASQKLIAGLWLEELLGTRSTKHANINALTHGVVAILDSLPYNVTSLGWKSCSGCLHCDHIAFDGIHWLKQSTKLIESRGNLILNCTKI